MVKALADRLAEAFAEYLHARVRQEWGYGASEALTNEDLIHEKYRGIRPAFGYPACPDHAEKIKLFDLLAAGAPAFKLTDSCAMTPAASVSGLYLSHPRRATSCSAALAGISSNLRVTEEDRGRDGAVAGRACGRAGSSNRR